MAYVIIHVFNPAKYNIPLIEEEPIGFTNNPEEAEDYVERYNEPCIYDRRKQFMAHQLVIEEIESIHGIPQLNLQEPPQTCGWFVADRLFSEQY